MVLEKKLKTWIVYRQTDERTMNIRKAHLSFKLGELNRAAVANHQSISYSCELNVQLASECFHKVLHIFSCFDTFFSLEYKYKSIGEGILFCHILVRGVSLLAFWFFFIPIFTFLFLLFNFLKIMLWRLSNIPVDIDNHVNLTSFVKNFKNSV